MFVNKTVLIPLFLALILGACSSDTDYGLGNGGSKDPVVPIDPSDPDPDPVVPTVDLALGSGSGGSFVSGAMTTTTDGVALSYGGDTAVTVNIVDDSDNSLYTDSSVTVSFTSNCVASGKATIDSTVIASNGTATAAYKATTCSGTDIITATLSDGTAATKSITIAGQTFGSLQFVSASPQTIALRGSGSSASPEVSDIIFLLRDNTGEPIQGKTVNYVLSTTVGGISLSSYSSVTSSDGTTSTTLNAGGVNVSVSVTATVKDNSGKNIVTTSKPIAIVGGFPDQNSFSISVETFNPRAWDQDGVSSKITIRAADRYNNPAPDATQISFVANGGSIVGSCSLSGGACSVNWTSQNPRPESGLISILARTTGEESFIDTNANGEYDVDETVTTHLDEAFNDENLNGEYDSGEFFSDFDKSGSFTEKADTKFQGTNCSVVAKESGHCAKLVDVREQAFLCMSTDDTLAYDFDSGDLLAPSEDYLVNLSSGLIRLVHTDAHGLTPAKGTSIAVTGTDVEIVSGASAVIPNTCGGGVEHVIKIKGKGLTADGLVETTGMVTVTVTQADNVVKPYLFVIQD